MRDYQDIDFGLDDDDDFDDGNEYSSDDDLDSSYMNQPTPSTTTTADSINRSASKKRFHKSAKEEDLNDRQLPEEIFK